MDGSRHIYDSHSHKALFFCPSSGFRVTLSTGATGLNLGQRFPCNFPALQSHLAEMLAVSSCDRGAYNSFSRNSLNVSLQKTKKREFWAEFDDFGEETEKFAAKFADPGNLPLAVGPLLAQF